MEIAAKGLRDGPKWMRYPPEASYLLALDRPNVGMQDLYHIGGNTPWHSLYVSGNLSWTVCYFPGSIRILNLKGCICISCASACVFD